MRSLLLGLVLIGVFSGVHGEGLTGVQGPFAATRLVAASHSVDVPSNEPAQPLTGRCGDYRCEPPEDCHSCPGDCGSCCGNHQCEPPEDCHSCPADCGACH